jgi:hypothetical protein
MRTVSNYKYTTKARVVNKDLPSYGKEVWIIKKVNRFKYLVEFSQFGRSYYMDVNSLEII